MDSKQKLTDKQKIFCEEYVVDWNATRAAKAAGYSENTAKEIGCNNLKKPIIQAYIVEIQKDLRKLAGVSALSNIKLLLKIAKSDGEKTADQLKAIEIVNKMVGLNAPDKKEIDLKGSIDEPVNVIFQKKK
jgi:phage terminase small subunit